MSVLVHLCARCREQVHHTCPVAQIIQQIESLKGIPVIVNDQLRHVVFNP